MFSVICGLVSYSKLCFSPIYHFWLCIKVEYCFISFNFWFRYNNNKVWIIKKIHWFPTKVAVIFFNPSPFQGKVSVCVFHQGVGRWAAAVEVTSPRCPSFLGGDSERQNVSVSLRLFNTESGSLAPTHQKCKASCQILHSSGRSENTFLPADYAGRVATFPSGES